MCTGHDKKPRNRTRNFYRGAEKVVFVFKACLPFCSRQFGIIDLVNDGAYCSFRRIAIFVSVYRPSLRKIGDAPGLRSEAKD